LIATPPRENDWSGASANAVTGAAAEADAAESTAASFG
jgi:hypothetical protein